MVYRVYLENPRHREERIGSAKPWERINFIRGIYTSKGELRNNHVSNTTNKQTSNQNREEKNEHPDQPEKPTKCVAIDNNSLNCWAW